MTTLTGCPDPLLLSQFLDRELAEEEEAVLCRHAETCIECNARLEQLAKAKTLAQAGVRQALQSSFVTPSLECCSPERVSAYVQRQLSAGEHEAAERHLRTCHKCLGEVMEAFRITKNLTRKRHVPVPAALKARVASQWKQTPAPAAKGDICVRTQSRRSV
jgi:anti-sigma factor RsiW